MENLTLENSTYVENNISLNSNLSQDIKKTTVNKNKKTLSNILNEYRLTQNNFNPNKKTPPNIFLNKLQQRMNYYYKTNSNINVNEEFKM